MVFRQYLPLTLGKPIFFVSPNGSDANGDGTFEKPWRTIGKGVSALQPYATLSIRGGTYVEPPIAIGVTNVTVTNYLNEKVILDAQKRYPTGEVSEDPMITLRADDVTVQGITVKNSMGRGFTIQEADNCTVKNCVSSWSMSQAMVCYRAYNAVVDSCLFEKSTQNPRRVGGSVAFRKCDSSTIKNSIVRNSPGEGINYFLGTNGRIINNTVHDINKALIYFENANGMLIDSNRLFYSASAESRGEGIHQEQENPDGYGGTGVLTGNNTIINNIVVNAQYNLLISGGMHDGEEIPGYGFKDIKVKNNTFINGIEACVYIRRNDDHDPSDNTASWFTNNILIQDDNRSIFVYDSRDIDKFTFANNYFSKDPGSAKIRGTDSLIGGDIKLVNYDAAIPDPAGFDPQNYQLTSSSPAIDAGSSAYPPEIKFDNFGNLRDTEPDIGAHEFQQEVLAADLPGASIDGEARPLFYKEVAAAALSTGGFKRFEIVFNSASTSRKKVAAFGIQFPDQQCLVYAADQENGTMIFEDVDQALNDYKKLGALLHWVD
jgi:hypothetical protein